MQSVSKRLSIFIFGPVLLLGACSLLQTEVDQETESLVGEATAADISPTALSPTDVEPTMTLEAPSPTPSSQLHTFDQLGISLEVPAELYVQKDPLVNLDDPSKLDSYLIHIQNYGQPGGPNSGDFQIYGIYQFNLPPISWEQFFEDYMNSPEYEYINPIEINGIRGFEGQFSGERNRFVYLFLLDNRVFRIAVSEPTQQNKDLADQIIGTLQLTGEPVSDRSHLQLIEDPEKLMMFYLPEEWIVNRNAAAGIRLLDLEARSPEAVMEVQETDGPHSNIYYKDGIFMNLVVLEDDSALSEPIMAKIYNKNSFLHYGFEIQEYLFVEPSTAEGMLREFRWYNDGLSYSIRFAFPDDTNQEFIDGIMRSLEISERNP